MQKFKNISLKKYNTFGIDCNCKQLLIAENDTDIDWLFSNGIFEQKYLIIGEGSNMLFTQDYDGTVIRMATKGMHIIDEDADYKYVKAEAGENWSDFVRFCIQNELYGAENLIAIPGLVGSSPVQNIGAYGCEVKDIIYNVEGRYIHESSNFSLRNEACKFAYRDSIFKNELKNQCLITSVTFRLKKNASFNLSYKQLAEEMLHYNEPYSLQLVAETVERIRKNKLPDITQIGCAGSFFKNPVVSLEKFEALHQEYEKLVHYPAPTGVKLAAGQLIELCGWKEIRRRDVSVYPKQALVIVNWGNATGKEVVDFYQEIILSVKEKFGVNIEPEVRII